MVNSNRWTFGGLRSRPHSAEGRRNSEVETGHNRSGREQNLRKDESGSSSKLLRGLSLLGDDDGSEMSEMITPGPPVYSDAAIARAAEERRENSRVVFVVPEKKAELLGKPHQTLEERNAQLKVSGDGMKIVSEKNRELSNSDSKSTDGTFFYEFQNKNLGLKIGIGRRALDKTPIAQVSAIFPECEIADKIEIGDEVLMVGGTKFVPTRLIDDFKKLQNEILSDDGPRPLGLTFKLKSRSSDYMNKNKAVPYHGGATANRSKIYYGQDFTKAGGGPPHSPPSKALPQLPQLSPSGSPRGKPMLRSASPLASGLRPLSPKLSLKKLRAQAKISLDFSSDDDGDGIDDMISPSSENDNSNHFTSSQIMSSLQNNFQTHETNPSQSAVVNDDDPYDLEVRDEVAIVPSVVMALPQTPYQSSGLVEEMEKKHIKTKEALCAALAATEALRRVQARKESSTNLEIEQLRLIIADRDAQITRISNEYVSSSAQDPLLAALTGLEHKLDHRQNENNKQPVMHSPSLFEEIGDSPRRNEGSPKIPAMQDDHLAIAPHEFFEDEEEEDPRASHKRFLVQDSPVEPLGDNTGTVKGGLDDKDEGINHQVVVTEDPQHIEFQLASTVDEDDDDEEDDDDKHHVEMQLATTTDEIDEVKVHVVSDDGGRFAGFDNAVEEATAARVAQVEQQLSKEHSIIIAEMENRYRTELDDQAEEHKLEIQKKNDEIALLNSQLLRAKKALVKVMHNHRKQKIGDSASTPGGSTIASSAFNFERKSFGDGASTIASTPGSTRGPVAFKYHGDGASTPGSTRGQLPQQFSRLSEVRTADTEASCLSVEFTETSELTLVETPRRGRLSSGKKNSTLPISRRQGSLVRNHSQIKEISSSPRARGRRSKNVGPIKVPGSPRQRVTLTSPGSPRRGTSRKTYTRWNMSVAKDIFKRNKKRKQVDATVP